MKLKETVSCFNERYWLRTSGNDFNTSYLLFSMMNCFCVMVDRRKLFSFISSRDHFQISSPSRISDTPQAGFAPAQNPSSGLVEWSCAVLITTAPRRHNVVLLQKIALSLFRQKGCQVCFLKKILNFSQNDVFELFCAIFKLNFELWNWNLALLLTVMEPLRVVASFRTTSRVLI